MAELHVGVTKVWEGGYHTFIGRIRQHPLGNLTLGFLKSAFQDLDDDLNQHWHQSNKSAENQNRMKY